ncbi:hypothetical protein [uncultured Brachyspira sp.]|uniref:hypothetical protein n=1 Tax=uncultured Brachyspira sp. TaxID=221953 RepID=UPI0025F23890|nr:hypothetical protein [uncultured Brachyspira sp.]
MKVIYSFMIGLILFNFYACTKQQIEEPLTENAKLEITYLDEKNNPTEKRTDNILMKLKDDESGFIMVSRKTGENEYTDYLIDTERNSTISMFYTNKSNFPYKIVVIQEGVSMVGYTSKYREETKDFDIIWEMSDGSTTNRETFTGITVADLFNHAKTSGVDDNTDYQIKTLKVSVRISAAINKYIDDNFDDNPLLRGKRWNAFCNFWKKVFKPIVRVVTIIVAVFVPPVAAIITTVVKVADAIINTIDNAINKTEEAVKVSSGPKKLYILKTPNNYGEDNQYTNTESIYLKDKGSLTNIIFDVTDDVIKNFKVKVSIPNEDRWYSIIDGYYKFSNTAKQNYTVSADKPLIFSNELKNNSDINLIVERLGTSIGHTVYMNIELDTPILINDKALSNYQLILQKE